MPGTGGNEWRGIALFLLCAAASLFGQLMVFSALLGLGFLTPGLSYSYNFQAAYFTEILLVGIGLVLLGILVVAGYQGAVATLILGGLILIPFGISVVYASCNPFPPVVPIGAGPLGSYCEPGEASAGFLLTLTGAGMFVFGLFRFRGVRTDGRARSGAQHSRRTRLE